MIYKVYSSLSTFKTLHFHPGLNILLADKAPGATRRHTRNRAGKSSLIEIIHFLLGASARPDSLFRIETLQEHTFGMTLDVGGVRLAVEKSGQSSKVVLRRLEGELDDWPNIPGLDSAADENVIPNTQWNNILGAVWFGLDSDKLEKMKYTPSFRQLFAYFVRRESSNAFSDPFSQSRHQQTWDQQVAISYLLGLDWTIPQQWQYVREREKTLRELRKAVRGGALGNTIGTTAELRTRLAVAGARLTELRERTQSFRVLSEYRHLEQEASALTRQIRSLADENTLDQEMILEMEVSAESEVPPTPTDLDSVYRDVGITLPESVVRRYDEVKQFHESVVENRRSYLNGEIVAAKRRIESRLQEMTALDERRSRVLRVLNAHGALEQLTELQAELARQEAETEVLRDRFTTAEQIEGTKSELEIERQSLRLRLNRNYREQKNVLDRAILAFEKISKALYEKAGSLTIDESSNGPKFDVEIHGARSKGIGNMQIFCFDMMLMQVCMERDKGPEFLIHDSHLFDGVDERQVGAALQVGAETAEEFNFQYIVTLNSDQFPQNYDLEQYILPVRLTDETESGGLFGIRFS